MTPSGQTVCLCMIVKDEAPVIRRCLDSVRPLIDHWVIVDTGSTDGTQAIVREHLRDVPGELVERPWRDFAHNRTEALALARPHGTYSLIIDADDAFEVPEGFSLPELDADSYLVDIRDTTISYQRTQLVRNTLAWRYRGVLHEFLACDEAKTVGRLKLVMVRNHDGARRRDSETYRKDAAILERALEVETDPSMRSRYAFYLAQSYRDCGEREKALRHYLSRAEMGFWDQEVFVSLYEAGKQMELLGRPVEEVLRTYERAATCCPTRAEAAHAASRLCRLTGQNGRGYDFAKPALDLTVPEGGLFVETWIYEFGLLDEFAVNAFWAGHIRDCIDACLKVLQGGRLPASEHTRFLANIRFAIDKLQAKSVEAAHAPHSPPTAAALTRDPPSELASAFSQIYRDDAWSHGSGPGSRAFNTVEYRAFVERFIQANGIRTVTDLGCGDWQFSRLIDWSDVSYVGFDVVKTVVERNRGLFASKNITFELLQSIDDLPGGDLLLTKEVLQHLPTAMVKNYIAKIVKKYRFALITNTVEPKAFANTDIPIGGYRPLRLEDPPFQVPGAKVLSYVVHGDTNTFQNTVLLVQGQAASEHPPSSRRAEDDAAWATTLSDWRDSSPPRVLVAILAKQKESVLPLFLRCIDHLDYPKKSIVLYIRTNNNTDRTQTILLDWIARHEADYAHVEFDDADVEQPVETFGVHEWNATRFAVLAFIRNVSLRKTTDHNCAFYFVVDVDNFLKPPTLRELVSLNLPIVAPLLNHVDETSSYSNFHAAIDENGYYRESDLYNMIIKRQVVGAIELPVVHCTYLIRADVVPRLRYDDGTRRHEYVIFSAEARKQGIPQFLDNRRSYGLLTLNDDAPALIEKQLGVIERTVLGGARTQGATVSPLSPGLRIIASMTTIPSRIDHLRPVVESIRSQTMPVEFIEINVPEICVRTGEVYSIPKWFDEFADLIVFRTDDYGPITKIAPTLLRYRDDNNTYIWSVDDDCAYPSDQLALLCNGYSPNIRQILTRYGGRLEPDGAVQFLYGEMDVTMFEGFGGVLYPPRCIKEDFEAFLDLTSKNEFCRKNDDIVLSMYFNKHGEKIRLINKPSPETPYMVEGWLPHSKTDALSAHGHAETYKRIHAFISSLSWPHGHEPQRRP